MLAGDKIILSSSKTNIDSPARRKHQFQGTTTDESDVWFHQQRLLTY